MDHQLKQIWCYVMPSLLSAIVITSVDLALHVVIFSIISPHGNSFDFGTLLVYHASARWRKDYLYCHGKHDKLTFLYDCARDGERRGPYSRLEKIDELWLLSSAFEGPTVENNPNPLHDLFLRAHNQNCTLALLPGSKCGHQLLIFLKS